MKIKIKKVQKFLKKICKKSCQFQKILYTIKNRLILLNNDA